ncbi:hypothetical protein NDU88_000855 [Pleurodeles waltl]|uniref:Uncharacterized protein n=1 Tax=Pleurodeles waltl TaxID=8319 RepID=A0AAV7UR49_PLEWA|nr:hypothetical protein NDU88_000855 [Pleurodeles waltl]
MSSPINLQRVPRAPQPPPAQLRVSLLCMGSGAHPLPAVTHPSAARTRPAPPPGKRTRKNKGRRARTDRAAPKEQCAATSPPTPSRGGKGPRAPSKERKGSRSAEKVDPTCHIPAGKEDTKEARSPSPKGPETSRSEGD